jgi:hypothetical protein
MGTIHKFFLSPFVDTGRYKTGCFYVLELFEERNKFCYLRVLLKGFIEYPKTTKLL